MQRMINLLLVALLLLLLLLAAPVAAEEVWEKQLGEKITAVATDERGDRIFVGTEGGMVYCYDSAGSEVWSQTLGFPIGDLVVDGGGDYLAVRSSLTPGRYELRNGATGEVIWLWNMGISSTPDLDIAQGSGLGVFVPTSAGGSSGLGIKAASGTRWYDRAGATTNPATAAISGTGEWVVLSDGADLDLYALAVPDATEWIAPYARYAWENRVSHTIAGTTQALTNYPIEITVIRGAGSSSGSTLYAPECRADFADIRFTAADGVTQIPYHLESVSGSTATFFVNIPSIPASPGTTTIYVYWGYSSTISTTSDPAAVYAVYDDFNDGVISPQWDISKDPDGIVQETGGYLELKSPYGTTGNNGVSVSSPKLTGGAHIEASVKILSTYDSSDRNRHRIFGCNGDPGIFDDRSHTVLQRYWGGYSGDAATLDTFVKHDIYITPGESTRWIAGSDWDVSTEYTGDGGILTLRTGDIGHRNTYGHMQIDYARISKWTPNEPTHGAWGPVESVVTLLDTKTLDGTIIDIDAPETGDWVAVSTTTKTYIIQITDSGFGTTYSTDRTGTPYQIQVADGGSFAIEGRNILADIFRIDAVQVGTYTTGGAVRAVALAQKNGLYAAAGSDDGKYYVFSKDAASSWYLLHASDSYDPVTTIAMSWRGELLIVGRADGRLTAFQVSEQDATGAIRVTIYKDNIPYATAPLRIEDGGTDQSWGAPTTLTTDDYGIVSIPVSWGNYIRITVGDDELTRVLVATPSQTEYVLRITGPDPLRTGAQYSSGYDPDTQRIYFHYDDTREKTHRVVYQIVRSSDNAVVFEREYTDADLPVNDYYQIPAGWTNTSYRVRLTASGSPSFTNTWHQWISGESGVASLPVELSDTLKTGMFMVLLLFIGGIFSYFSGPHGAVVVSLVAAMLVFWGWLPISPAVIVLCVVWAFLGLLGRTSVG